MYIFLVQWGSVKFRTIFQISFSHIFHQIPHFSSIFAEFSFFEFLANFGSNCSVQFYRNAGLALERKVFSR